MQISALRYFTVPTMVNKCYDAENQCSYMGRKGNVTCLYLVQLRQDLLGQFNVLFLVCTCTLTHIISLLLNQKYCWCYVQCRISLVAACYIFLTK